MIVRRARRTVPGGLSLLATALVRRTRILRAVAAIYLIPALVGGGIILFQGVPDPVSGYTPAAAGELTFSRLLTVNLLVAAGFSAGGLLFGIPTVGMLLYNGLVHGVSFAEVALQNESLLETVLLFGVHGVIEIPAFWLAATAGLTVPAEISGRLVRGERVVVERESIVDAVVLTLTSFGMIVVAGVIETYLTVPVASAL